MTSSPTVTNSLVLERGHLVAAAHRSGRLLGVEQTARNRFELTFNEMHPEGTVTVETVFDDRLVGEHGLLLKQGDVVTIPAIGTKMIGTIMRIREGRYQVRLEEKYVAAIVVDIDMSELVL